MKNSLIFITLTIICFGVYFNSLQGEFISDDLPSVEYHKPEFADFFHPTIILNELIYLKFKLNVIPYHVLSVLMHAVNSFLVYLVLGMYFDKKASFLGALIFAVHPIHTEAVSWISGRAYLFHAFAFYFIFYLYNKKFPQYLLALTIYIYFTTLYYPWLVGVVPFLLILNYRRCLPFLAVIILKLAENFLVVSDKMGYLVKSSRASLIMSQISVMSFSIYSHFKMLVWPIKLTFYYEPLVINKDLLTVVIFALTLMILYLPNIHNKSKGLFIGVMAFLIMLMPTYSLKAISNIISERYVYISSIFLSFAAAYYAQRFRRTALVIILIITCLFSYRTILRNNDWRTALRFWTATIEASPKSPKAHNNLGCMLMKDKKYQEAIPVFRQVTQLNPKYPTGWYNFGMACMYAGYSKDAVIAFQNTLMLNRWHFNSAFNAGAIYYHNNLLTDAINFFAHCYKINPRHKDIQKMRRVVYERTKYDIKDGYAEHTGLFRKVRYKKKRVGKYYHTNLQQN